MRRVICFSLAFAFTWETNRAASCEIVHLPSEMPASMERNGQLAAAPKPPLPTLAPGISSYAAAARALSKSATPLETRLALIRALEGLGDQLAPSPGQLVASHVVYALTHSASASTPAARAAYWAALRGNVEGRALVAAAVAGLRGGREEAEAVLRVLAGGGRVRAGLESRAELVAAGLSCLVSPAADEDLRPLAMSVVEKLVDEWSDAQDRCGNARRVFGVSLNVVLATLVKLPETPSCESIVALSTRTALKGLLLSPFAVLEKDGYFASLYPRLKETVSWGGIPSFFAALLRECVASSRAEDHQNKDSHYGSTKRTPSKRNSPGEEDGGVAQAEDAGGNVLPRVLLIPLVFMKDLTVTARTMLERADNGSKLQVSSLLCIAELFSAATAAGIYRTAYDSRPVSKGSASKRRRIVGKDSSGSKDEDLGTAGDAADENERGTGSAKFLYVGQEIAATCLSICFVMGASDSEKDGSHVVEACCEALCASLRLSLDVVVGCVPHMLKAFGKHSKSHVDSVVEHVTRVLCCLVECYAATRQLPEFFTELARHDGCLHYLSSIFSKDAFRDTLVPELLVAPRGHPEACIRALFVRLGENSSQEGERKIRTDENYWLDDTRESLFLSLLVVESVAQVEFESLGLVLAEVVVPVLRDFGNRGDQCSAEELLLAMKGSVLYVMASSGLSVDAPQFSKALFAALGSIESDAGSTPDSDSSDYEAFIARRRARESRTARFKQLLSAGSLSGDENHPKVLKHVGPISKRVKYFSCLAYVLSGEVRKFSSPVRSEITPPLDGNDKRSSREFRLCIAQCWSLFTSLDLGTVNADLAAQRLLLRAAANIVYLSDVMPHGIISGKKGAVDKERGLTVFLTLALEYPEPRDFAWSTLWESKAVQKAFVKAFESVVVESRSRAAVSAALDRCIQLPKTFLDTSGQEELSRCCGLVLSRKDSDLSRKAVQVLSTLGSLPGDVIEGVHKVLKSGELRIVDSGKDFFAAVLRNAQYSEDAMFMELLRYFVSSVQSCEDLQWLLSGVNCALADKKPWGKSHDPLRFVLLKVPELVHMFGVPRSNCPGGAIPELGRTMGLLLELTQRLSRDAGYSEDDRVYSDIRESAQVMLKGVLRTFGCSADGVLESEADFFVLLFEGGQESLCKTVLGPELDGELALRVGCGAVAWASRRANLETSRHGGRVLRAIFSGRHRREAIIASLCHALRIEFGGIRPRTSYIHPASVLLSGGAKDPDLALSCLRIAVAQMREWGWIGKRSADGEFTSKVSRSESVSDVLVAERHSLVLSAVSGGEAWLRAQMNQNAAKWQVEHILQLFVQICDCENIERDALVLVLKSCISCTKAMMGSTSRSRSMPTGTLWAVQRVIAAVLRFPSRLDAMLTGVLCQVYESVASSCPSSQMAPPVVVVMTADLANALTNVTLGSVRRAAIGGISALLDAGSRQDAVVASAMFLLSSDIARDVLRAVRAEAVDEGAFYRGRA